MVKTIEKVLKDVLSANKYKCGTKQVLQYMKGSKLIILSNTLRCQSRSKIEEHAKLSNVPLYLFDGNSLKLGKLCNKSFRISAIAVRSATDAEIDLIKSEMEKRIETPAG